MTIEKCTLADCARLAAMNKQLIEDEKHENPMNVAQLEQRMRGFLSGEYSAYFFRAEEGVAGYALMKDSASPKYLRHFFICRECRRKGYGRAFFGGLMEMLGENAIDIEVLCRNEAGVRFWESLGFLPRSIYMRYQKEQA